MNLLVNGVHVNNLGSMLMLLAVIDQLKAWAPSCTVCATPHYADFPRESMRKLGLTPVWPPRLRQRRISKALGVFPAKFVSAMGYIQAQQIGAFLDMSGYSFGDNWAKWATPSAKKLVTQLKTLHSRGGHSVFLPQAFGPFKDPALKEAVREMLTLADLVFARDMESLDYASELWTNDKNCLKLAPDFTNLINGVRSVPHHFQDRFCIVPSVRMLDQTDSQVCSQYVPFLCRVANSLVQKGENPFFLIHENGGDEQVAEMVNSQTGERFEIVTSNDPLYLKTVLGMCKGVLSSRFHALISSLSQAVPSIALGWTHKYQALMEDYASSDFWVSADAGPDKVDWLLDMIVVKAKRARLVEILSDAGQKQKEKSQKMWKEVHRLFGYRG